MLFGYLVDNKDKEEYIIATKNINLLRNEGNQHYIVKIPQIVLGEFIAVLQNKKKKELKGWINRNREKIINEDDLDSIKAQILGDLYNLIQDLSAQLPPIPPDAYRVARLLMCLNNPNVPDYNTCFSHIDSTIEVSYYDDDSNLTITDALILACAILDLNADYLLTTDSRMVGNITVEIVSKKIGRQKSLKITESLD